MLKHAVLGVVAFGVLCGIPRIASGAVMLAHDDQVHYGGHLLAGRVLSLWPGTMPLAEVQYTRGLYHARTPRQVALLTSERPRDWRARMAEAPVLARGLLRHASRRLSA